MEVLGLVGSPRKGGNTDILVDAILDGARGKGHRVGKVYLHDFEIGPCIDCRGCKRGEQVCVVEDGMQEIYGRLDAAEVIVFGTPVYWCGPSGTMKQTFDRLRPYYASERLKGKKAILAVPAASGPAEADLLVQMFRRSFSALKVRLVGQVLGTGYDEKDILADVQAMEKATALGAAL